MQMAAAGYRSWGVGRHVLGSNYFYYVQDPWGSFSEYSATMDYIPASVDWVAADHAPEDGMYLWGPDLAPSSPRREPGRRRPATLHPIIRHTRNTRSTT